MAYGPKVFRLRTIVIALSHILLINLRVIDLRELVIFVQIGYQVLSQEDGQTHLEMKWQSIDQSLSLV